MPGSLRGCLRELSHGRPGTANLEGHDYADLAGGGHAAGDGGELGQPCIA